MESWVKSERVFEGRLFNVVCGEIAFEDGQRARRDVVAHPGSVGIVPYIDERVILVKQYRIAVRKALIEIPAGTMERGDSHPEARAAAELEEETGYRAGSLVSVGGMYCSPGYVTERIEMFLAFDLEKTQQNPDPDERIEVLEMPVSQVRERLAANGFEDAKTVFGLYALIAHLNEVRPA